MSNSARIQITNTGVVVDTTPIGTSIVPGGDWDGTTSWTGRTAPTLSMSNPNVLERRPVAAFTCPPLIWYDGGTYSLGVVADHSDQEGIDSVVFWMEGQEIAVLSTALDPGTEIIGYNIDLDNVVTTFDGDAEIFATVTPVNGVTRVIGPVKVVMNTNGSIPRTEYTLGPGGDFTTLTDAMSGAADGAIVKVAAGTHPMGAANISNLNDRLITIQPADGLVLGDVSFEVPGATRLPLVRMRALNFCLRNLHFDMKNFAEWYGLANALQIFENCSIIDSNGVSGPEGDYSLDVATQSPWRYNEFQRTCFLDCTITNYCTSGGRLYRGCQLSASWDLVALTPLQSNGTAVFNTNAVVSGEFNKRLHIPLTLTVATVTYDSGADESTFTISGTPFMDDVTKPQPNQYVTILSGTETGLKFDTQLQSSTAHTILVAGDATAVQPGDQVRSTNIAHADALQANQISGVPLENIMISGYTAQSIYSMQPVFWNPHPDTYIDGIALRNSVFYLPGGQVAGQIGPGGGGVRNLIMRQTSVLGTNLLIRRDKGSYLANSLMEDCIFTSVRSGEFGQGLEYGPEFLIANNCHFEVDTQGENVTSGRIGTNATGPGSALLDTNLRPLPTSPTLYRGGVSSGWSSQDATGELYAPENPIGPRATA